MYYVIILIYSIIKCCWFFFFWFLCLFEFRFWCLFWVVIVRYVVFIMIVCFFLNSFKWMYGCVKFVVFVINRIFWCYWIWWICFGIIIVMRFIVWIWYRCGFVWLICVVCMFVFVYGIDVKMYIILVCRSFVIICWFYLIL